VDCIGASFSVVGPFLTCVLPSVGMPDRAASVGTNRSPAMVMSPRSAQLGLDAWEGARESNHSLPGRTGI